MNAKPFIEYRSSIPYYYQLQQILRHHIQDKTYEPGDKLPGEHELCCAFDISRTVIRQALAELEFEGVVYRRKGRGTFVAHNKVPEYLFQNFTGLSEDVAARGGVLRSEVRRLETAPAPVLVAQELDLETDTPVIVLERLRFINEIPWTLTTTYVPYELCPQLLTEDFIHQSLYTLLEEKYELPIHYGRRSVEAIVTTPDITQALGNKETDPILRLRSTAYDKSDRAVEYFVAHHRGGPIPDIMPTGGVSVTNVGDWFAAGAVAVGAGGELASAADIREGDFDADREKGRRFVAAVEEARRATRGAS